MKSTNIIKIFPMIIFCVLVSFTAYSTEFELTQIEESYIQEHPVIKVANEMDWPPFDFNEFGKPKGLSIDYIKLIARKVGFEIDFVNGYTWEELVDKFKDKQIDVMPIFYKNKEREEYTYFTKPYQKGALGIYTNENQAGIHSPADLLGKRVGIQSNHGAIPIIKKLVPDIVLQEYPETLALVQMLSEEKLDAIIGNPLLFEYIAKYNQILNINFTNNIKIPNELINDIYLHIGIRKDLDVLYRIIEKALESIPEEEVLRINRKWLYFDANIQADNELILTPAEKRYIKDHPVIYASNEKDYAPYDFSVDGQPRGFSIDLLNLLAAQAGIRVEYVNGYSWTELVGFFNDRKLDLMHTITKNKEREKFGVLSDPYCNYQTNFYVRKSEEPIVSIKQLYGKTAIVGRGWNVTKYIKKYHSQVNLIEVNDIEEMIGLLSAGEGDALINDGAVTDVVMRFSGIHDIERSGIFKEYAKVTRQKFHFFAHKDSAELISILNKAYRVLSYNKLSELYNKWFGDSSLITQQIELTPEEKTFLAEHPVVSLAGGVSFEPFIGENSSGEIEGHDVDIADIVAERTGVNFEFTLLKWSEAQKKTEEGMFDGLLTAAMIPGREKLYNVSLSYMQLSPLIIVKKGNPEKIYEVKDLAGKKVGFQKGNGLLTIYQKFAQTSDIVYYDTIDELIQGIVSEEVDLTLLDQTAFYVAERLGLNRMIEAPFSIGEPYRLSFLIRKDWPELVSIINKGLRTIKPHESLKIRNKWFGESEPSENSLRIEVNLTPAEQEYLNNKRSLKYVVDPDNMPLESINTDGKHIGISADYLDIIARRLQTSFELVRTKNWADALAKIRSRESDLTGIVTKYSNSYEYLDITTPCLSFPTVLVTRDEEFLVENISDHLDKVFVTTAGFSIIEKLHSKYPELKLLQVPSAKDGLIMVRDNDAFAYIDSSASMQYLLQHENLEGLKVSGTIPLQVDNNFATRSDEPILNTIIQKALNSISEDERNRIKEKWVAITVRKVTDYTLIWQVILVVSIMLIIIGIWNRKLKHANQKTEDALARLQLVSITDRLTGLSNRFKLDNEFQNVVNLFKRYKTEFSIILLDIDHFKDINDHYGHLAGDRVLREIAERLLKSCRVTDIVGRWGGEEFLIICPQTELDGAFKLAENVRAEIEALDMTDIAGVTASFGVASYCEGDNVEGLLKKADVALYNAKNNGRNRVERA